MDMNRALPCIVVGVVLAVGGRVSGAEEILLKDVSFDRPLVLDDTARYRLENVRITGLADCAALMLSGRIGSVTIDHCAFGNIWAGSEGKAAAMECAGAAVGTLVVTDSVFFDAEHHLISLKEGSFGRVTLERCRFFVSESCLRRLYADNPWRTWPPVMEFHNIDRLELLDNEFENTTVVIHPSVKKVVVRGKLPEGWQVLNRQATRVIRLDEVPAAQAVAREHEDCAAACAGACE